MALAGLLHALNLEKGLKVFYVLVDHGIRKNSSKEAYAVKKLLRKKNISLIILKNKKKVIKNIQGEARSIRYRLLTSFSKRKKIKYILTAHHSDDQIETFLIRLSRGSGIQGLSSMKSSTVLDGKIKLLRPLLDIKKADLIFTAKKIFGKVFKDPSNTNKKYLRTRMRSLKKILETSGISHEQIIRSIKNLASSSNTLNKYIEKIYKLNVKKEKKRIYINFRNILIETKEVQLKILSKVIVVFSKSYYPPRSKKILNVINTLVSGEQKKMTLSGCIIEKYGNQLLVRKEP